MCHQTGTPSRELAIFTFKALIISDVLDTEKTLDPETLIWWKNVHFYITNNKDLSFVTVLRNETTHFVGFKHLLED